MQQIDEKDHIYGLMTDYLTGELDGQGAAQLAEWVSASEENKREFVAWKEAWIGSAQAVSNYDAEAAFRRFKVKTMHKVGTDEKAWRAFAGKHRRKVFAWAASVLIPVLMVISVSLYSRVSSFYAGEVVLTTIEGQQSTFVLPDGTKVSLQENSQFSYCSNKFVQGDRSVDFTGEAYFVVESDESHPFIITTPTAKVKVVGTEFNLKSRAEDQTDVLRLDKGKVELTSLADNKSIRMMAGDEATINRSERKIYNRHRSFEEQAVQAQTDDAKPVLRTFDVEELSAVNGGYSMKVVVDETLSPGTYEVKLSPEHESLSIQNKTAHKMFTEGDGSKENPYVISSARQMCNMKSVLRPRQLVYFALASDIDLKGVDWEPLNSYSDGYAYWISLDGRQHVIRNLTPSVSTSYSSFFGVLCGECRNVGFEDVNISSTGLGAGVLGGYLGHKTYPGLTVVENCYFTGRVSSKSYVGAIGGNIGGKTVIRGCSSGVDVTSVSSYAGGLIGKVHAELLLEQCYVEGSVAGQHAGGIVGGGQDPDTPASRYISVVANNRSVYGSISSDAIGGVAKNDEVRNVSYCSSTFLNGMSVKGGRELSALRQQIHTWKHRWYYCKDKAKS